MKHTLLNFQIDTLLPLTIFTQFSVVQTMQVSTFREGLLGASGLVWSPELQAWFCGDEEGTVYRKSVSAADHVVTRLQTDPILAIAVHPNSDECVVAEGDSLCLRSLKDMDSVIQSGIFKTNLPFTGVIYDHSGSFV
jgi:hypothetical protein